MSEAATQPCGVEQHCCWVDGRLCPHLEEYTVAGRRWACGLLRRLGSWVGVYRSAEYQRDVRPMWERLAPDLDCGSYPAPGMTCATCGGSGG